MRALMDVIGLMGESRYEKSCTRQNLPGLFGFGIIDRGEVWKGPMVLSSWALVKGPMWRCMAYSCCKMVLKWSAY